MGSALLLRPCSTTGEEEGREKISVWRNMHRKTRASSSSCLVPWPTIIFLHEKIARARTRVVCFVRVCCVCGHGQHESRENKA